MNKSNKEFLKLYSIMNNDAIRINTKLSQVRKDSSLIGYIYGATSFLKDSSQCIYPIGVRINFILDGVHSNPTCPTCGEILKYLPSKRRFQNHCCPHCALIDPKAQEKRKKTCLIRYGNESFNNHKKQVETMERRYGVSSALSHSIMREKGLKTKQERYGTPTYNNPEKTTSCCKQRYGTGRNNAKVKATMLKRYGVETYLVSDEVNSIRNCPEIQSRIQETKRKNHTFNVSKLEDECYKLLCEHYGYEDVKRQYRTEEFPYNCDFYITSLGLYIEFNGHWSHGKHPFDPTNKNDLEVAEKWNKKKSPFYNRALWVWTVYDVEKRKVAKDRKINRIEFWTIQEIKKFLKGEAI